MKTDRERGGQSDEVDRNDYGIIINYIVNIVFMGLAELIIIIVSIIMNKL